MDVIARRDADAMDDLPDGDTPGPEFGFSVRPKAIPCSDSHHVLSPIPRAGVEMGNAPAASKRGMRYLALASDYDGTLAHNGRVSESTLTALEALRSSGRKLMMVTGRELPDLKTVFPALDLFDRVVAENGALLYDPATRDETPLADQPPAEFIARLSRSGIPFSVGRGIVATVEPHEKVVLQAIKELGLELQVIFNKGSVMVLPSGLNKATGLRCALNELGLSDHNVVAVGDAENDHAFLAACEFGVAVANALPMLKDRADLVTQGARGAGVEELIADMIEDDLERFDMKLRRHQILLGRSVADQQELCISPYRGSLLVAGPSGSGKSTVASGIIERIAQKGYQFCLIDPEGDYEGFPGAIVLGTATNQPNPSEVLKALQKPAQNLVVNLLGVPLADRPVFFASLFPTLIELRTRTARPHFIIVDEAHHLLPSSWIPAPATMPKALGGLILITVHPDWVARAALEPVNAVVAVGKGARETLANFAGVVEQQAPQMTEEDLAPGTVAVWIRGPEQQLRLVQMERSRMDRRRHIRKYATGELTPDRSFYFRGPNNSLNLRAQNLNMFLQIAEGVDDATWLHHLRAGDYSRWFREYIKDPELADEIESVEHDGDSDAKLTRDQIRSAIDRRYTAAA
jgi:hydroxymethylpyrimidine pyrophosphatase-like HAD family hydrolase